MAVHMPGFVTNQRLGGTPPDAPSSWYIHPLPVKLAQYRKTLLQP